MADPQPPTNGSRWVSRYEWDQHTTWAVATVKELKEQAEEHGGRIDRLESKWDRYTGPIVFILVLMGAIATIASIISAVFHIAG